MTGFALQESHVRGDLFNEKGKWKYTVLLDYDYPGFDYTAGNLWRHARAALVNATDKGISGVTMREIPLGWFLVVLEPYSQFSHPIVVR